jgi:hypothetical protein
MTKACKLDRPSKTVSGVVAAANDQGMYSGSRRYRLDYSSGGVSVTMGNMAFDDYAVSSGVLDAGTGPGPLAPALATASFSHKVWPVAGRWGRCAESRLGGDCGPD